VHLTNLKSENDFYVTARDGIDIFVRHAAPEDSQNKAVVIAHGIPGNPNEYIHMSARNFFIEKGYNVYRMSFYDDAESTRKLHTTTLQIQANDLNDVVAHVSTNHESTYVCGHSYGGATTLFANPSAQAIAFWDSSFYVWALWDQFEKDETTFDKELLGKSNRFFMLFSKEMMAHARAQNEESMAALTSKITAPSLVLNSGEDYFIDSSARVYDALICEKEKCAIPDADHQFLTDNTVQILLNETHKWFERF